MCAVKAPQTRPRTSRMPTTTGPGSSGGASGTRIPTSFPAAAPARAASSEVDVGSNKMLTYRAAPGQLNQVTVSGDGSSITVTDPGTDSITILNNDRCLPTADPR